MMLWPVGSRCFRGTLADYQQGSLNQRSACWDSICRGVFAGMCQWESTPERLHSIDGSLGRREGKVVMDAFVITKHLA
jgi:hypothetical protein